MRSSDLAAIASAALLAAGSCTSDRPKGCRYHGSVTASDGRTGTPCTAVLALQHGADWIEANTLQTRTGGAFEGTVTPVLSGNVAPRFRVTVACEGYGDVRRDLQWDLGPQGCADRDLGTITVARRQ